MLGQPLDARPTRRRSRARVTRARCSRPRRVDAPRGSRSPSMIASTAPAPFITSAPEIDRGLSSASTKGFGGRSRPRRARGSRRRRRGERRLEPARLLRAQPARIEAERLISSKSPAQLASLVAVERDVKGAASLKPGVAARIGCQLAGELAAMRRASAAPRRPTPPRPSSTRRPGRSFPPRLRLRPRPAGRVRAPEPEAAARARRQAQAKPMTPAPTTTASGTVRSLWRSSANLAPRREVAGPDRDSCTGITRIRFIRSAAPCRPLSPLGWAPVRMPHHGTPPSRDTGAPMNERHALPPGRDHGALNGTISLEQAAEAMHPDVVIDWSRSLAPYRAVVRGREAGPRVRARLPRLLVGRFSWDYEVAHEAPDGTVVLDTKVRRPGRR